MVSARLKTYKDIFLHKILHVEDTPHRIALGAAAGIFIAWTPTFGLQTILAIALAALVGGNKAVTIPMVWLTNPLTNIPIYGFSYLAGHFLMTGDFQTDPAIKSEMISLMRDTMNLDFYHTEFWGSLMNVMYHVGLELWIGSILLGLLLAGITYPLIYYAVINYRKLKKKIHLHKLHEQQ
jgi:uncharacterized protein (DUF2062 family)